MVSEWVIELHNEFYDVIILKKKKNPLAIILLSIYYMYIV